MSSIEKTHSEMIVDLSNSEVIEKEKRIKLKKVKFAQSVMSEMLLEFISAKPNETIVFLTGVVKDKVGYVLKIWRCDLSHADFVSAETNSKWLSQFAQNLAKDYPIHNMIILAHIHPIGSSMSGTDQNTLFSLTDSNEDIYFGMIACDIPFGLYTVTENKMHDVQWEVIRWQIEERKESLILTNSTISEPSWARRFMKKFQML